MSKTSQPVAEENNDSSSSWQMWVGILLIAIIAVLFRIFVAPLIYEKTTADVFKTDSQWSSSVTVAPGSNNYCRLVGMNGTQSNWPTLGDRCMVEGLGIYIQTLQRRCELENCIDFNGELVPTGIHPFTGMCESDYCGITETKISFAQGEYVTVSDTSPPILQSGNSIGDTFMMRRYGFDKDGKLIPQIDGVFARFIYVDTSFNQYFLNYYNRTSTTSSDGSVVYISKLQLTNFGTLDFPSGITNGVTLFLLMDTLDGPLLNMPHLKTSMARKILIFYSPNITDDSTLMSSAYIPFLIIINSRKPIDVFTKGLRIGAGIVTWKASNKIRGINNLPDGYYVIDTDYIQEFDKVTSQLWGLSQDILEARLVSKIEEGKNIPFYSWEQ